MTHEALRPYRLDQPLTGEEVRFIEHFRENAFLGRFGMEFELELVLEQFGLVIKRDETETYLVDDRSRALFFFRWFSGLMKICRIGLAGFIW